MCKRAVACGLPLFLSRRAAKAARSVKKDRTLTAVMPAVMMVVVMMVRAVVVVMIIPRAGRRRRHATVHNGSGHTDARHGHIHPRHGNTDARHANRHAYVDGNGNARFRAVGRTAYRQHGGHQQR